MMTTEIEPQISFPRQSFGAKVPGPNPERVVIFGSRSIEPGTEQGEIARFIIQKWLSYMEQNWPLTIMVIHGGADGVDSIADEEARLLNIPVEVYRPDYRTLDPRRAPLVRNDHMAKLAERGLMIWDGESTGSQHMLTRMVFYRRPVDQYIVGWHYYAG